MFIASPVLAEISGEIELKSDDRFRGRSLSIGLPVIDVDISVDTAVGIYAGGSVTGILGSNDRAGLQGVDGYVGYAKRIDDNVTIDMGIAGYVFTQRYSGGKDDFYGEVYAGVSSGNFAAYVHYTPNYFDKSVPVLYTDLSMAKPLGSDFILKAHAGLLMQTSGIARLGGKRIRYDTRIALSRPVLGLNAELAWTFAGPEDRYFDGPWDGRSAVVFSLSKHF